jgi:hypothetical protein
MPRCGLTAFVVFSLAALPARADLDEDLSALKAVYATRPQGYPTGTGHAQPDSAAPFRWHGYHDDAIRRFDETKMSMHAEPYNPLEDEGVTADKPVRFAFVAEHATSGKKALRMEFPAEAIRQNARVQVKCVASPILSDYHKYRRSAYWSHYRWLKADAFNPVDQPVRVRVCGVPLVLAPGSNVISVKTADAVGWRGDYPAWFMSVPIEVAGPERDVVLFLDNFRMEQETPAVITKKGRLFQFPIKGGEKDSALMLWPGFTAIEKDTLYTPERGFGWTQPASKRTYGGLSFRSNENGLIWCRCENADSPLRFDVPNGRWGVWLFATPVQASVWTKGVSATINGQAQSLFPARSQEDLRRVALAGELWDYRPGSCLWAELVRDAYFPSARLLATDVKDGHVSLELPLGLALRAVILFPEEDRAEALREIGRLEYLLAESWDVAHAWVRGAFAEKDRYIGVHDEMVRPETIPTRLDALNLTAADFRRGFALFQRGLTDPVYPDTIPTPGEIAATKAVGFAAPGENECLTIGLLPLAERKGLRIEVSDLVAEAGRFPAASIDVRLARYHHKCMEYGHHNHNYNFEEHFLVRRPRLDIYPGAAQRIYLDVSVPGDAKADTYRGELRLVDAGGATLATVPLELEVTPVKLRTPEVFFGIDNGLQRGPEQIHLRKYGINFIGADHDTAAAYGFQGYAVWPYNAAPPPFKGRRLGWSSFVPEKALMNEIIAAGKSGKGPRGYFGGYVANKPADQEVYAHLVKEFPDIDILGVTTPVYAFHGADYPNGGEQWRSQIRTRGKPELLEQAAASGKEFWFFDWMRHSKEQAGRFSFGFWLWRLGAKGRYSTFSYGYDYHYGTARQSSPFEPYYTLLGVVGGNACPAMRLALDDKDFIPARDLLLIREGIADYRYIYTLDRLIHDAESKKLDAPAMAAARKFRDQLRAELSLDLTRYYESRTAAYAENWYPRADNPWTHGRFQEMRRQAAEHIIALQAASGP